jgi:hypothetical protein
MSRWSQTCSRCELSCLYSHKSYQGSRNERPLTTITPATNAVYVAKSPGPVNLALSLSNPLPYWYRKYGSSSIANFGFVIRNAVKMRQTCGTILVVKMTWLAKMYLDRLMIPP